MALTRIALNNTATYSGAYYFSLNPSKLNLNASSNFSTAKLLDGGAVKQSVFFDSRPYTMEWQNIPFDYGGFGSMLATLQSWVGEVKYVNFGDVDYAIPTLGWVKIQVTDLNAQVPEGGKVKYNISFILTPEAL